MSLALGYEGSLPEQLDDTNSKQMYIIGSVIAVHSYIS